MRKMQKPGDNLREGAGCKNCGQAGWSCEEEVFSWVYNTE
jgi:hypothetical protein